MTVVPPDGPGVVGWTLLRLLGRGSHGAVYLAEPAGGGPALALKLVPLDGGGGVVPLPQAQQAFLRSAEIARRLVHAAIVTVHAAGVDGSTGWLAMEAVPGGDLGHLIAGGRRLPEALALHVAE